MSILLPDWTLNMKKYVSLVVLVGLLAIGCTEVDYVGESFKPTTNIDLYFSKEDIEKEYTVMGHAIGSGIYDSNAIQKALIEEAKEKGADAVLITGIDDQDNGHESEVTAPFLKYK